MEILQWLSQIASQTFLFPLFYVQLWLVWCYLWLLSLINLAKTRKRVFLCVQGLCLQGWSPHGLLIRVFGSSYDPELDPGA
jgi:hypothetical protein